MVEVSDIVNAYITKGVNSPRPSPIYLFILINANNITKSIPHSNMTRITLADRRTAFKNAWDTLNFIEKSKYTQAATQLGYVTRFPSNTIETSTSNLVSRLKSLRASRAATKAIIPK